jgi:spore germination protein KA
MYIDSKVTKETLDVVNTRLLKIDAELIASPGQLSDYLDDSIWSPFPQLLNTERPDRVVANLMEGKVAIFVDHSSTALIGPVTFFSFFQTPDDYYGRILVGSFYKILRISSFLQLFLPLYISIVSFHFEVLPIELSKTVKEAITHIPYPPFFEAFILEIAIELIREASIRLPSPVGQTIGIVGGLVIGDAVITAGLVSNIMVIVVSLTAISSFVIPAIEMNAAIRLLRFPFMLAASLFGFLGIAIDSSPIHPFIEFGNLSHFTLSIIPFNPLP